MRIRAAFLSIALVAAPSTAPGDDGNADRGRQVYESRCIACHSLDANRVGPRHRGVFGRRAGIVDGYRYSEAIRESGVVWTDAALDAWLANPGGFIPGSKMGFRLSRPGDRADVIAFLKRDAAVRD